MQRHWKHLAAFEEDSFIKIIILYDLIFFKNPALNIEKSITRNVWNDRVEKHA